MGWPYIRAAIFPRKARMRIAAYEHMMAAMHISSLCGSGDSCAFGGLFSLEDNTEAAIFTCSKLALRYSHCLYNKQSVAASTQLLRAM